MAKNEQDIAKGKLAKAQAKLDQIQAAFVASKQVLKLANAEYEMAKSEGGATGEVKRAKLEAFEDYRRLLQKRNAALEVFNEFQKWVSFGPNFRPAQAFHDRLDQTQES